MEEVDRQETPCELDESRWSVVSFDRREGSRLSYAEAIALMKHLDTEKVTGLCIVTDEAAEHMTP